MDGFSVSNANQFLKNGLSSVEGQSFTVDKPKLEKNSPASEPGQLSFADTLNQAIDQVNQLQKTSDKKMQDLATGRTDNVADVMIAAEKADIALRVMVQVRNKIIDAYNEIMKMQV